MPVPLLTLLSQALVAYTIEFGNEAEHRMPQRTTRHSEPGGRGVGLVSMAMWLNCATPTGPNGSTTGPGSGSAAAL